MNVLYLAWQNRRSRQWFPVGRLVHHVHHEQDEYEFAYIRGVRPARDMNMFMLIPGFSDIERRYKSPVLFPTFRYRVMNLKRPDRDEYLQHLGIDSNDWDEIAELSVSGGLSHLDGFELFPPIEPDADGRFETQFILHGLRHTNPDSIRRADSLGVGESLELSFEVSNPATMHAINVKTTDHYILGWLPRYLIDGLHKDNAWMITEVEATVARVNLSAPLSHRLLVSFKGKLPEQFSPMRDLDQYQPIAPVA